MVQVTGLRCVLYYPRYSDPFRHAPKLVSLPGEIMRGFVCYWLAIYISVPYLSSTMFVTCFDLSQTGAISRIHRRPDDAILPEDAPVYEPGSKGSKKDVKRFSRDTNRLKPTALERSRLSGYTAGWNPNTPPRRETLLMLFSKTRTQCIYTKASQFAFRSHFLHLRGQANGHQRVSASSS